MHAAYAKRLVKIQKIRFIKEGLFYALWTIGEIPGDPTGSEEKRWSNFKKREDKYLEAWKMAVETLPFEVLPIALMESDTPLFDYLIDERVSQDPNPSGTYSGRRQRARGYRKRQAKRTIRKLLRWLISALKRLLSMIS